MFVYRTIEKTVFWEFDSIIMQNMSHNLLLFCTQTWPSPHVIENHLLFLMRHHLNERNCSCKFYVCGQKPSMTLSNDSYRAVLFVMVLIMLD